jgi:signal transduction histidine kinase
MACSSSFPLSLFRGRAYLSTARLPQFRHDLRNAEGARRTQLLQAMQRGLSGDCTIPFRQTPTGHALCPGPDKDMLLDVCSETEILRLVPFFLFLAIVPDNGLMESAMSTEGEQLIEALDRGEIDAVISRNQLFFLRLRETEEALRLSQRELEQRVREGTEQIAQQADQLRKLTAELTLAEQRERFRLAEVLHGHLQQLLAAVNMKVALLKGKTIGTDVAVELDSIRLMVDDCIKATRILSIDLAPPMLGIGGFSVGLDWLAKSMQERYGLRVELVLDRQAHCMQEDVRVLMFQSVRELLFNVAKHAKVSTATITTDLTEDARLRITVSDEGAGFDLSTSSLGRSDELKGAAPGFGLYHIRERLTMRGGQFTAESEPGKGSRFALIAPPPQS